jgi:hypothetical protein
MPPTDPVAHPYVSTIEFEGTQYTITCRISFDGIEYLGRLWFTEEGSSDEGIPDRASIPGRTPEEVLAFARRLSPRDLVLRHHRAIAEKRRFLRIRQATEDILTKIRYMNQVAVSIREGWIDREEGTREIDLTTRQLHDAVDVMHTLAGVEG